ncbi:MAG: MotA/TolQ/ExbB proton channel family protein, partial [Odoribacter sp.]|nr:MotA/TolQ/ExbB proton channel family protein [Odoribacter sp.]
MILLAAVSTPEQQLNIWDMIIKGGWLMLPIFILSVITVYIFCERYVLIRKYAKTNALFLDKIKDCVLADNIRGAVTLCHEETPPLSRMLIKGIPHLQLPAPELRSVIESSANLEVSGME